MTTIRRAVRVCLRTKARTLLLKRGWTVEDIDGDVFRHKKHSEFYIYPREDRVSLYRGGSFFPIESCKTYAEFVVMVHGLEEGRP
jgi:hypothetical protein